MAHNDFIREDGVWPPETVPTARDWATFDRAQSKGFRIGWANESATPLVLGGAGLVLTGHGHSIEGGVRTESGGRLVLGNADYPILSPAGTREVMIPFGVGTRANFLEQDVTHEMSFEPFGVGFTAVQGAAVAWPIPPECLHQGGTLTSAVLRFRVGQAHDAVPGFLPRFTIYRASLGHGAVDYLAAGGSAGSGGGATLTPTPSLGSSYYAEGAVQAITLACTTANVIDVGGYSYVVDLFDETSSNSQPGNIFHSLTLNFSAIADARPE